MSGKRYFEVIANYPNTMYKIGDVIETGIIGISRVTEIKVPSLFTNHYFRPETNLDLYPEIFAEVTDEKGEKI